jgi:beta-lactamase class D
MKQLLSFSFLVLFLNSCTLNKPKTDDLKKYFDEYKVAGCFGLYDNGRGEFSVYNMERFKQRFTPASTFKIVNSLIGLQTGKLVNENMVIKWDGVVRREPWNKDLTMAEAFKVSAVPYYQQLARRIGKDTMKLWVDSLKYGNMDISGPVDSFWLNNKLKISPDEELGLIKKLYFNQLPFQQLYCETVKKVMVQENNASYELAYKTGWGFDEKGNSIGWIVGWIEENNHPYFFVLNLQTADKNFDMYNNRIKILKNILTGKGFFKGEK